jgi:membrane-associated phospholipid phosphatase
MYEESRRLYRDRRARHWRVMHPVVVAVEIVVGVLALGGAALAGLLLVHRPWPNRLDVDGFKLFPAEPSSRLYGAVAQAGSLRVLVVGVVAAFLACVWRDRGRAAVCLVGPALAVLVTERVAKPLVGRHVTALGGNSYPSGTVTAATALALVIVLAAPRLARPLLGLIAIAVVAAVCVAVVGMRWHYPTDAMGGVLVGSGTVFLLDGLAHLPETVRAARRMPKYDFVTEPTRPHAATLV